MAKRRRRPSSQEIFGDILAQIAAIEAGHVAMADGTWRCPGCGRPYDEIPVGHSWTYGNGGSCS